MTDKLSPNMRGILAVVGKPIYNTPSHNTAKVQDLIISNVKADLARRIAARVKIVEIEPTDAPDVEDAAKYEDELRKELEHSYNRLDVQQRKRRRAMGSLRDSSVELAGP